MEILHSSLELPSPEWVDQTAQNLPSQIRLCKITSFAHNSSADPLSLSCTLMVNDDLSWDVFALGQRVERHTTLLSAFPDCLNCTTLKDLLTALHTATICCGHPDPRYIDMAKHRKGTFIGGDGTARATLQYQYPVIHNGEIFSSTIRTTGCELLSITSVCSKCKARLFERMEEQCGEEGIKGGQRWGILSHRQGQDAIERGDN